MKNKLIIGILVMLLIAVIAYMVSDLMDSTPNQDNPYKYELGELDSVNESVIDYAEVAQIEPEIDDVYGITFGPDDRLFVTGTNKVLIYDSTLVKIKDFEIGKEAWCIAYHEKGLLFLGIGGDVEVWDTAGTFIRKWEGKTENSLITSIAVSDSSVFIADAGNKLVFHYSLNGNLIREIGAKDSINGIPGFIIPSPYFDLLLGRQGELWVVNPGLHEFEQFDNAGNIASSWQRASMDIEGFCGCCNPSHIAMLSDGSFVTSEKGIVRVKVHEPTGDFRCVVAGPDSFDEETKDLDLAVDSKDRIFVMDPYRGKIRIFKKTK